MSTFPRTDYEKMQMRHAFGIIRPGEIEEERRRSHVKPPGTREQIQGALLEAMDACGLVKKKRSSP